MVPQHSVIMPPLKVSVLLPTYRQPELLTLTLRDLNVQRYPRDAWELVLIDDGSRDSSATAALLTFSQDHRIVVKRFPTGGAYRHASLLNELARLADPASDVYVHVEDVRVRPDFLAQHAKWHYEEERFLVTGPMCEGPAETFEPSACGRWRLMEMSRVSSRAYRCCFQAVFAKSMSYPRPLLETLTNGREIAGPFDELMVGWGYHETEFAFRAECAGAVCVYDTDCGVYHPAHNARDELQYRGIDRGKIQAEEGHKNAQYLCRKHGLADLPDWRVGSPLASPPLDHEVV